MVSKLGSLMVWGALLLAGCGGGSGSGDSADASSLIGAWNYAYPNIACVEKTVFREDKSFLNYSRNEIQEGTYSLELADRQMERYRLSVMIAKDNKLASCTGSSADDSGKTVTWYLQFDGENAFSLYSSQTSTEAAGTFSRE